MPHPMLMLFMAVDGSALGISGIVSSAMQEGPIQFIPCCLCPAFPNFMNCFEES